MYQCQSKLVTISTMDKVDEYKKVNFAFTIDQAKVTFSKGGQFDGAVFSFEEGGSYVGDEFWVINQGIFKISFVNNNFQFLKNENVSSLRVMLIHAKCDS